MPQGAEIPSIARLDHAAAQERPINWGWANLRKFGINMETVF